MIELNKPRPHEEQQQQHDVHEQGFGHKTIGTFGSLCLLSNNVTGPGLVVLCSVFQSCGWLYASLMIGLCFVVSTVCCLFLCEAMTHMEGNRNFQQRFEFISISKHYLSPLMHTLALIAFLMSLQGTNMTSIVQSSQTADETLLAAFGRTCAIQLYPFSDAGVVCITRDANSDSPFGSAWVVSVGFVVVMFVTIPFAYLNLDENIGVQVGAFIGLLLIVAEWLYQFKAHGFDWSLLPTATGDLNGLFGSVLFNFAFITTIPSWVNEKRQSVSIYRCVWASTALGSAVFVLVGFIGALSYKFGQEDLLTILVDDPKALPITRACVYLFPLIALLTSIPIFSIIVRYNLLESQLCTSVRWANFWATVAPWFGALLFYSGDLLNNIVNWTGLLAAAPLNFMLPCWMFVLARRESANKMRSGENRPLMHQAGEDDNDNGSNNHNNEEDGEVFRALPASWPANGVAFGVLGLVIVLNVLAIVVELTQSKSK